MAMAMAMDDGWEERRESSLRWRNLLCCGLSLKLEQGKKHSTAIDRFQCPCQVQQVQFTHATRLANSVAANGSLAAGSSSQSGPPSSPFEVGALCWDPAGRYCASRGQVQRESPEDGVAGCLAAGLVVSAAGGYSPETYPIVPSERRKNTPQPGRYKFRLGWFPPGHGRGSQGRIAIALEAPVGRGSHTFLLPGIATAHGRACPGITNKQDGGQGTNELGEEQQEHETLAWFVFGNAPPLPQGLT
ncbi:hypothetical protein CFAM422_010966 [Trichoderma lentiforme]|uniref:Uncharacterized protein n=1 Tax=Trichoderma lentiforme TaxID=1567552 RepID=A0A9P4X6K0_9HYPO|nr:hypothetical protein CFAM422_010966 [Trichoderma lentiforme]